MLAASAPRQAPAGDNSASASTITAVSATASPSPGKASFATWWKGLKRQQHQGAPSPSLQRKGDEQGPSNAEPGEGIFGVPLADSIQYAHVAISLLDENGKSYVYGYIPTIVAKCGVYLKNRATEVEGIFRLSGSAKRIKDLQEIFDSPPRFGKGLNWDGFNVHDAANVLRRYINNLPEPIIPLESYEALRSPLLADPFVTETAIEEYKVQINKLPPLNRQLLLYLLDLLAVFASKAEVNRMNAANLSAIFQPGILNHPDHEQSPDEYKLSQDVVVFLIQHQDHFLIGMDRLSAGPVSIGADPETPTSPVGQQVFPPESPTQRRGRGSGARLSVSPPQVPSINITTNSSPSSPPRADAPQEHPGSPSKHVTVPGGPTSSSAISDESSHPNITHVFGKPPNSKRWLGKKRIEGGISPNSSTSSLAASKTKPVVEQELLGQEETPEGVDEELSDDSSSPNDESHQEKKSRRGISKLMLSVNSAIGEKETPPSGSLSPKNPLHWLRKSKSQDEEPAAN